MLVISLLETFFKSFFQVFFILFNPIIFVPVIIIIIIVIKKNKEYKNSVYYQITQLPYGTVVRDTGRFGEYLIYKYLKEFEINGAKFLFNIYIPKENDETSEIDALMICSKGIFVFESKNYSGWIFGSEFQKNWYQTLPSGRGHSHKEHFYNPIMQNYSHIKYLKKLLGEQIKFHSVIVFSERCTLKNINIKSDDIHVINRYDVFSVVSKICDSVADNLLTENDILDIYNKLYPYTQVDQITKDKHIRDINTNLSLQNSEQENNSLSFELNNEINDINEGNVSEEKVNRCPKCGSELVLRTATRGSNIGNKFYGCSNFPKCRYIQGINNPIEEEKRNTTLINDNNNRNS